MKSSAAAAAESCSAGLSEPSAVASAASDSSSDFVFDRWLALGRLLPKLALSLPKIEVVVIVFGGFALEEQSLPYEKRHENEERDADRR